MFLLLLLLLLLVPSDPFQHLLSRPHLVQVQQAARASEGEELVFAFVFRQVLRADKMIRWSARVKRFERRFYPKDRDRVVVGRDDDDARVLAEGGLQVSDEDAEKWDDAAVRRPHCSRQGSAVLVARRSRQESARQKVQLGQFLLLGDGQPKGLQLVRPEPHHNLRGAVKVAQVPTEDGRADQARQNGLAFFVTGWRDDEMRHPRAHLVAEYRKKNHF